MLPPNFNQVLQNNREQSKLRQLEFLKTSNPMKYNTEMCNYIHEKTENLLLPKLTNEEMNKLKEHLTNYNKIPKQGLQYEFLNLKNCFRLIYDFEEEINMKEKIIPIIQYIKEFDYIFELIIKSLSFNELPDLEKALIILHFDISKFCMRYAYMLVEIDIMPSNFKTIEFTNIPPPTLQEPITHNKATYPPFDRYDGVDENEFDKINED